METKRGMKENFIRYFMLWIALPFVCVFTIAIVITFYYFQYERESKQELVHMQIEEALEKELTDGAIQFSQLLLGNDNAFLLNLGNYFNASASLGYSYQGAMQDAFELTFVSDQSIISLQAYSNAGQEISFKTYISKSFDWMKELPEYQKAVENSDNVERTILDASDLFEYSLLLQDSKVIVFMMAPEKEDLVGSVDLLVLSCTSDALEAIETASEWSYGVDLYLFNENNDLLIASEDTGVEKIADSLSLGEDISEVYGGLSSSISGTNWTLVTITTDKSLSATLQVVLFLIFLVLTGSIVLLYLYTTRLIKEIITPIHTLATTMQKVQSEGVFEEVACDGPKEIAVISETYNGMIVTIEDLIEDNKRKERAKIKEEILALEAQINPHFLSNTINTIQVLAKFSKHTSIERMADSLNRILKISFKTKKSFHTLEEDLQLLDAYIYIMEIRYANSFTVSFDVDEATLKCLVPKLMLQPFVENAIVHAFSGMEDIGELLIKVEKKDENLLCTILDNGNGMSQQKIQEILEKLPENGDKIAIANINQRLKLYFGEAYNINIESELGKYTKICFSMPIQFGDS